MLEWVEQALGAAGHDVDHVDVAEKQVGGCISCMRCQQDPDEWICAVQDEGNAILKSIVDADAVVYATPLYCWSWSGQLKPLMDRHLSFVTGYLDPATHKSHLEGKTLALLVTCGGPDEEGNTDCMHQIWKRLTNFSKCDRSLELVVPFCMDPEKLGDEHQAQARAFAEEITG